MQAIQALNPYNSNWTIKARVASKGQLRSFTRAGSACSVFSAELIDSQVVSDAQNADLHQLQSGPRPASKDAT